MGGLADALAKACRDLGVEIRRESAVRNIVVDAKRVRGVMLEDGRFLEAPIVGSSVDPHLTFERFLGPQDLPAEFRRAVARIDYASASMKINVALSEPPRFRMLPATGVPPQLHGTIHISPTLDYIERAYEDARAGRPSQEPILECTIPSSVDPTLAPAGHYVMSMFIQYAPYQLAQGSWDDIKESFADRCLELLGRYAPNIPGAVLHRQVVSPLDLERTYGITGGNIFQGAMAPHQLYFFRPVPGWADHRTPVGGLYLCGAAAHPGGGVIGACGRNAAEVMIADGY